MIIVTKGYDAIKVAEFEETSGLEGNVKYAGQVKTDGTNPDFYTVRREA